MGILEELYFMVQASIIQILVFRNTSSLLINGSCFYGLCLTLGTNEFLGSTVITNLFTPFPSLVEWVCGGYCVYSPTLKRFFLFHSSNNPLRLNTNNKVPFFPFIFIKDFFGFIL